MINCRYIKAMWLSQFDMWGMYCKDGKQRPKDEFKKLLEKMFENIVKIGINTVIVQTRPNADSMYPSKYYPMSKYVVGKYGREALYDPLEMIIEASRKYGTYIHTWINPLRCMTEEEIVDVPEEYAVGSWYKDENIKGKMLIKVGKNYYLDPAYDEVRKLIINGAVELLSKYDVDGLHMDDYFYPTADKSFDEMSYQRYVNDGGELSVEDFRRDNLDKLVSGLYKMTKEKSKDLMFGISPAGSIPQVINKHFANVERWCSDDGFIDYIIPQVYFGFEHPSCPFAKLCDDWQMMIKNEKVDLIIGMTLGKAYAECDAYAKEASAEWKENKDVMRRSLEYAMSLEKCKGVSYFCYQYFYDPITGDDCPNTEQERKNLIPLLKEI